MMRSIWDWLRMLLRVAVRLLDAGQSVSGGLAAEMASSALVHDVSQRSWEALRGGGFCPGASD